MTDERPTHLDLFSGIGGFALAAKWAGFRTIGFCEIEPYCQKILAKNFGAVMAHSKSEQVTRKGQTRFQPFTSQCSPSIHSDIFTLNGRDYAGVDLITGGFPCQPFSCAGKRRGKADDRHLWPEMRRVIAEARPAWVLGENVPGIIGMELDGVLSDLEAIGYACWPLVIPACAVDAKHRRDRVWIVAHSNQSGLQGWNSTKLPKCCPKRIAWESSSSVADAKKLHSYGGSSEPERNLSQFGNGSSQDRCNWLPEPELGRVAHGIPRRVDRLSGLGNAIVPQVAAAILKAMRLCLENIPTQK